MKRFSLHIFLLTILVAAVTALPCDLFSSPYRLSPFTDSLLAGSGAALYGISVYTDKYADPLTDQQISGLSKSDINRFDRSAADNRSPSADRWSTALVYSLIASPISFAADSEIRKDFITIGVMYAESLLITAGANKTTKNLVQRNRPLTYNRDVPLSEKKDKDAVLSFYSGHTAYAFNSAVFTCVVFSDCNPQSRWRYAVWGTALSAAGVTGYLRYRAGKHFPTDIIAGAAAGSLTGWMVPALHRSGSGVSFRVITGEQNTFAVEMNF